MGKLSKSTPVQMLLGGLIAAHMAVVKRTTRWDVQGFERVDGIVGSPEGVIALTWHSRFLMLNSAWRRGWQPAHVMISRSRNGDVVHYATRALGLDTIRGSSRKIGSDRDKGGARAGIEVRDAIADGACIVITPDGPRGPRQRVQMGPLRLARATGAPIVPCSFGVSRGRMLGTWDRLVLPGWFGRGIIRWAEPVRVPRDADDARLEELRAGIEAAMNADTAAIDAALGRDPVHPA